MEEEKVPVFGTWKKAYWIVIGVEFCVILSLYLLTVSFK